MEGNYNLRNPAVKRLMREAQELKDSTEQYSAHPLDDNLFEWHFTIRGPEDTDFADGFYHGRIILPPEYPMKPPSIILLTPSGRFETNKKICLSISGYHPETWLPSWSLRTALLGIIGFLPSHGGGAIGSLDYTPEERKALAKKSHHWKCEQCGLIKEHLLPITKLSHQLNQEAKEIAQQINLTGEKSRAEGEGGSPVKTEEGIDPAEGTSTAQATTLTTSAASVATAATTTTIPSTSTQSVTTTTSHLSTMTYQLPPYNLAHAYPFAFPPFPFPPITSSQQPQQSTNSHASFMHPQFMWPYAPNFVPPTEHQHFPSFNPPINAFPRNMTPFPQFPFGGFSSDPISSPLRVITSQSSPTPLTNTTSTVTTTPTSAPITSQTLTSLQNATTSASEAPSNVSFFLSNIAKTMSSVTIPSSTTTSSSSSDQSVAEASTTTESSASSTTESSASSSLDTESSSSPSSSGSATELRNRFKSSTAATSSSSTTTSSSSTTAATSCATTTTTATTTPRVVRTAFSAEPSHRFNHHTPSGFLDAMVDLFIILILFLIFGLLSRRVFMNL